MFYNHPIHGSPDIEDIEEMREECQDWVCSQCGAGHPFWHKECWHCRCKLPEQEG